MPAKRMTGKTMWYGQAKDYVDYKHQLANELKLHLLGTTTGGSMVVTEKWDRKSLPTTATVKLEARFYRDSRRPSDVDNLLKMAMDFLQTAGVIYNDDQVREVHATVEKPVEKGRFELELTFIIKEKK